MKAVFQSVNIDFEIIFRLCVCLLLCILYNIQLESRTINSTQKSLLSILTNIAIFLAKDAKINLLHKQ